MTGQFGEEQGMQSMTTGGLIGYFGYGSLVNRKTLRTTYVDAVRGELKGFRREWNIRGETPHGPVCALTASRDPDMSIQGLLVVDLAENLGQVDEREARYDRMRLSDMDLDLEADIDVSELYVYQAKSTFVGLQDPKFPIWQSYVDAVMQGYMTEFGEAGLQRFVSQTRGWEQAILADRDAPHYPRAVELSVSEQRLFDDLIREIRPRIQSPA